MKRTYKYIICFFLLVVFVGIISSPRDNYSHSINEEANESLSVYLLKDEHVAPFENVYFNVVGNLENIKDIKAIITDGNKEFVANLVDVQSGKPYFELPYYNNRIVLGHKYYVKEVTVTFINDLKEKYINDDKDKSSYFVVGEFFAEVNAWRDFNGIDVGTYSNGNYYFKLYGDTKEIVNIEMNWVRMDEKNSFNTFVEGFENRPFFTVPSEKVAVGEEYYLKDMTIYYNNGGTYTYTADNYANILNNRIVINEVIIDEIIEEGSLQITERTLDSNKPNPTNSADIENDTFGGLAVLILIFVAGIAVFFYLKRDED